MRLHLHEFGQLDLIGVQIGCDRMRNGFILGENGGSMGQRNPNLMLAFTWSLLAPRKDARRQSRGVNRNLSLFQVRCCTPLLQVGLDSEWGSQYASATIPPSLPASIHNFHKQKKEGKRHYPTKPLLSWKR